MRSLTLKVMALAAVMACAGLTTAAVGQDYQPGTDPTEKLKQELTEIDPAPKPGTQVVALRDVDLMVKEKTVGTARRGEELTVEQVQGDWLWVRSGDVRGWVDEKSAINAALMDWYRRVPNNESVEMAGRVRAKLDGVLFDIQDPGEKNTLTHMGTGNTFNGIRMDYLVFARFTRVGFTTYRASERSRALGIKFNPRDTAMVLPPPPHFLGTSYGTIGAGDFVFIDTDARKVFVNGDLRKPKSR